VLYVLAESTARAALQQTRETERLDGDRYVVAVSLASEGRRGEASAQTTLVARRLELFAGQIGIGCGDRRFIQRNCPTRIAAWLGAKRGD
jgi:hypothetical protein